MYSYRNSSVRKRDESFVPKRTSSLQLADNRSESTIQQKQKNTASPHNVIQLGVNKDHKKKTTKKKKKKGPFDRPTFTTDSKKSAMIFHNNIRNRSFKIDLKKPALPSKNAAQPHRLSWKDIAANTKKFQEGGSKSDFEKITNTFVKAGELRIAKIQRHLNRSQKRGDNESAKIRAELLKRAQNSQNNFKKTLANYLADKTKPKMVLFLKQANSFHANVPDYGPHFGVNQPVSAAMHLNLRKSRTRARVGRKKRPRSPSPMSRAILENLNSNQVSHGIAVDKRGRIITTSGKAVKLSTLSDEVKKHIRKFKTKEIGSYDPKAPFGSEYKKN